MTETPAFRGPMPSSKPRGSRRPLARNRAGMCGNIGML